MNTYRVTIVVEIEVRAKTDHEARAIARPIVKTTMAESDREHVETMRTFVKDVELRR